MRTIYKYPFDITGHLTLSMPESARIIHVNIQIDTPCLWAVVDTNDPAVQRRFRIFGTGHPIPEPEGEVLRHVGSFQMGGGALVFHMFEDVTE